MLGAFKILPCTCNTPPIPPTHTSTHNILLRSSSITNLVKWPPAPGAYVGYKTKKELLPLLAAAATQGTELLCLEDNCFIIP